MSVTKDQKTELEAIYRVLIIANRQALVPRKCHYEKANRFICDSSVVKLTRQVHLKFMFTFGQSTCDLS